MHPCTHTHMHARRYTTADCHVRSCVLRHLYTQLVTRKNNNNNRRRCAVVAAQFQPISWGSCCRGMCPAPFPSRRVCGSDSGTRGLGKGELARAPRASGAPPRLPPPPSLAQQLARVVYVPQTSAICTHHHCSSLPPLSPSTTVNCNYVRLFTSMTCACVCVCACSSITHRAHQPTHPHPSEATHVRRSATHLVFFFVVRVRQAQLWSNTTNTCPSPPLPPLSLPACLLSSRCLHRAAITTVPCLAFDSVSGYTHRRAQQCFP